MSANRDQKYMRGLLASVGIMLPEPITPAAAKSALASAANTQPAVDRDEVRRVLVGRGAPERSLEWLVASCPSIEHARGFTPAPESRGLRCFDGRRGVFDRETSRCKLCSDLAWRHSSTEAA